MYLVTHVLKLKGLCHDLQNILAFKLKEPHNSFVRWKEQTRRVIKKGDKDREKNN